MFSIGIRCYVCLVSKENQEYYNLGLKERKMAKNSKVCCGEEKIQRMRCVSKRQSVSDDPDAPCS